METQFNEQESLKLIQEMIENAKSKLEAGSFFYLLWGWLVLAGTLIHFGLLYTHYAYPYLAWPAVMLAGLIGTTIGVRKSKGRAKTRTYLASSIGFLWTGFSIMLLFILFSAMMGKISWSMSNIFIIALYGLSTFASGGMIHFRPLIYGGIFSWLIAIASLFVAPQFTFLSIALSIVVSYLIPGYLLRNKEKSQSHV
jgi:hypothetical protein